MAIATSIALWEYYQITEIKGCKPLVKLGLFTATSYVMANFLCLIETPVTCLPSIILSLSFLMSFIYFIMKENNPLINLAITFFGIIYLSIPLTQLIYINYSTDLLDSGDGRYWVAYILAVTKMTDIGGYFVGKSIGKIKLAEHISPHKTLEGAVGGLLFAIATSVSFPYLIDFLTESADFDLQLWPSIFLGLGIGILAQLGDLGESLLKRDAGVKDSNQLPGLGGVLDTVDSLVFTIPLVYFYLQL